MTKYFVKTNSKHVIEPEEILVDAERRNGERNLERLEVPVSAKMLALFFYGSLGVIFILAAVTFYYQIIRGKEFWGQSEENRFRALFVEAPRGLIFDRFGKELAGNTISFDILVSAVDLPQDEVLQKKIAEELARVLDLRSEPILSRIREIKAKNRAEAEPIFSGIPQEAAISLKAREVNLPGVKVIGKFRRSYPSGADFAHLVGYTGRPTADEMKQDSTLGPKDQIGRQGLEAFYEAALRGEKGESRLAVDAALNVIDTEQRRLPRAGDNLVLTIDAEFQSALASIIRDQLSFSGLNQAAAVALNPQNGEILALVSLPSFDNNLFSRGITKEAFSALINARAKPLFQRAVSGEYSPGSTVKPFIAAAALEEGIVSPNTIIDVSEDRLIVPNPYDPERPTIFRDWKAHGRISLEQALADSSNIYFYTIGGGSGAQKGLGVSAIKKYLEHFGFGAPTTIDLAGEKAGLVPDPDWKKEYRKKDPIWRIGDTYLLSIGQGDLLVTPVQLAAGTAALVNGGNLWQPHLLKEIKNPDGSPKSEVEPRLIRRIVISPQHLETVKRGMRQAAMTGTAAALSELPISAGGKTGTAQVPGIYETNAFFTAFMPYEKPEILLVVVVEGGKGGITNAVPIAKNAFWWYWANRIAQPPASPANLGQ